MPPYASLCLPIPHMAPYESLWHLIAPYGFLGLYMTPYGPLWLDMATYGSLHMAPPLGPY